VITVPFDQSPAFEEKPNSWKRVIVKDPQHAGDVVMYTCPNGHTSRLEGWDVNELGEVSPSVDCSPNGCDFHDNLRLEGWP
jgi:hypothetical protein